MCRKLQSDEVIFVSGLRNVLHVRSERLSAQRLQAGDLVGGTSEVGEFTVSPGGLRIAFSWRRKGVSQIHLSPVNSMKPVQLTNCPGSKFSLCWSPDESQIAYMQEESGREQHRIKAVDLADGSTRTVLSLGAGTRRDLTWAPHGHVLAFSSDREGHFDIFTVSSDGSKVCRLTSGQDEDAYPEWSPDGNWLLFSRILQGTDRRSAIGLVRSDGSGFKPVGPSDAVNSAASWSPDGTRIAFLSEESGSCRLGIEELQTGQSGFSVKSDSRLLNPSWSPDGTHLAFIEDSSDSFRMGLVDIRTGVTFWHCRSSRPLYNPIWSPDGGTVILRVDKGGNYQMLAVDTLTGQTSIVGPQDGLCSSPQFASDGKALLFTHEGPQNPTDLWHLSLSNGELRQLSNGLPPSIDRRVLVVPEEIHYRSFDGMEVPAFLFRPRHSRTDALPPAIVWVHGGPNYQFRNIWNPTVQLLVNHGYAVLAPNFRGSTGYGKAYSDLSIRDWGGGDVRDIIAAGDFLESSEEADGGRIALWGGSYGGYLLLLALAGAPKRWAAGVDLYGFVDLETFWRSTQGWIQDYVRSQIGAPEDDPEFYRDRSPITHCNNIIAPLVIFQGANDSRVPIDQSRQLSSQLESQGNICTLRIFEDEGHGFQKVSNQIDAMETGLAFLSAYLGGQSG
jgi:dipeptidyl aminopeptidase/acylaminoacyl peptidase